MTPSRGPKVVLLCGGMGTRMREETEYRPKPMVEVGGQPLLWHIMKLYAAHGLTDFVCCLGYRGAMIKQYFLDYHALRSDLTVSLATGDVAHATREVEDWNVSLVDTGEEAMTGSRVKRVERHLAGDDLFLCTYGDGLADIDIDALLDFHRSHGRLATVTGVRPPSRFGELVLDGTEVTRFAEKPTGQGLISGGFFVFDRAVLGRLSADPACVLEREPLEQLAADGELQVFRHDGFWQCADTMRDVEHLRGLWDRGDAPWRVWDDRREERAPHPSRRQGDAVEALPRPAAASGTSAVRPIRRRAPGARPLVCVALPVRNGMAYLGQAIDSVLAQLDADIEVRVLDNGSHDGSLELAQAYAAADPRVTAAANPFDLTYYGSLNRALAETDAEYFVPFASDDVMYPHNLSRKVELLEETGAALAASPADLIDEDGTPLGRICPDYSDTPRLTQAPDFFRRLMPANAIACQAVVVRTDALRAVGGFDVRSYYAADWLAWMRLALRHPIATLPDAHIANRVHTATITQTGSAAGLNARDVPATLDHVFGDERVPEEWQELRDTAVSASHSLMATDLQAAGIMRVQQGWAAYMAMARALARAPGDVGLRNEFRRIVLAAGLHAPTLPCEAVARAPLTADEAAGLAAALGELGPLLESVLLRVEAHEADAAVALLEPVLARLEVDVDVVLAPGAGDDDLLLPGRLALAPWGGAFVAVAESAGIPVFPYGVPDPFAAPPDPARWQTVAPEHCLV